MYVLTPKTEKKLVVTTNVVKTPMGYAWTRPGMGRGGVHGSRKYNRRDGKSVPTY